MASIPRKAFKDWFDRHAAHALATQVAGAMPDFDRRRFVRLATRELETLEFSARVRLFADALSATLPDTVPAAPEILTASLPEPLPDCESVTDGWL